MAKLVALALPLLAGLAAGQSNGPGFRNGNPVSSQLSQTSPTDPWGLIALMVGPQEPALPLRTPPAGSCCCCCRTMRAGPLPHSAACHQSRRRRTLVCCCQSAAVLVVLFGGQATEVVKMCVGPAWLPTGVLWQVVGAPACSPARHELSSAFGLSSCKQHCKLRVMCGLRMPSGLARSSKKPYQLYLCAGHTSSYMSRLPWILDTTLQWKSRS